MCGRSRASVAQTGQATNRGQPPARHHSCPSLRCLSRSTRSVRDRSRNSRGRRQRHAVLQRVTHGEAFGLHTLADRRAALAWPPVRDNAINQPGSSRIWDTFQSQSGADERRRCAESGARSRSAPPRPTPGAIEPNVPIDSRTGALARPLSYRRLPSRLCRHISMSYEWAASATRAYDAMRPTLRGRWNQFEADDG